MAEENEGVVAVEPPVGQEPEENPLESLGDAYDRAMKDHDKPRDEQGRFAPEETKKMIEAEQGGEPEEAIEATEEDSPSLEGEEAGAVDATDQQHPSEVPPAPAHLPKAIKESWAEIPEAARETISEKLTEYDKKAGELGEEIAKHKDIASVSEEFKEYFDGTKASYKPAEAMRYMFNIQRQMDRDPLGTLYQIADTYGLREQLGVPADANQETLQLRQQVASLQNQLEEQGNPEKINSVVSQAIEEKEVQKAIDKFATENEFYADVEDKLPSFIEVARDIHGDEAPVATVLQSAYEMAVQALPDVREKKEAADKKAKEAEKATDDKKATAPDPKRAQNARKAASINVKSNASGKPRELTEVEALDQAYERAMAN